MRKSVFRLLLATMVLQLNTFKAYCRLDVDWGRFLSRHDLIWNRMPRHWYDAPFMGNGEMGLMIYQEPDSNFVRFETGNSMVHDHREANDLFGKPRLLTGHFKLCPVGRIVGAEMRLDLWNGVTLGTIHTSEGAICFEGYVHADKMLIVVETTTRGNESGFQWEWEPAEATSPRALFGCVRPDWVKTPEDYYSNPSPMVTIWGNGGTSVQDLKAGGQTAVCWEEVSLSGKRCLLANVTHSYPSSAAVIASQKTVNNGVTTGAERLKTTHTRWWHQFYPKSFLTIPDAQKEGFYWIQLYKLASATRADRALIDNTGPWLTVTPWPNAWWNLNVQLTYWPLNGSNHIDMAASLEHALYDHTENLRDNVPEAYRHDSFGLDRFGNMECQTAQIGMPGEKGAEVGLLTWVCHNLWLIYRHKMDDALLREKLFPLLKGAVNYYLHFLQYGADGKLHLPLTYSPEYGDAEDCNFDLALLKWGCATLVDIDNRLHLNDTRREKWEQVLADLTPFPADSTGLSIGRGVPYAFSHRHFSHQLSVYPLYLLNREQSPDTIRLIKRTIATWHSLKGDLQGYTFTSASSMASALGDGDAALEYLNRLFDKYLSSTTMYKEAGPVIETPLSGAQSILDMLLQSWGNKIRIFPAVPTGWEDAAFGKLLAEGAFEVSAKRENRKTTYIAIRSLAGEPCIVVTDMEEPRFSGISRKAVKQVERNTYRIALKKGETVKLHPAGTRKYATISPIEHAEIQPFGLN